MRLTEFVDHAARMAVYTSYYEHHYPHIALYEATIFNLSVLNLVREGDKKTFKKKNIEPIFEKVNEGDEIKKKHWTNF